MERRYAKEWAAASRISGGILSEPGEVEEGLARYFNTVSAENPISGMTLVILRLSLGYNSLSTVNTLVKWKFRALAINRAEVDKNLMARKIREMNRLRRRMKFWINIIIKWVNIAWF